VHYGRHVRRAGLRLHLGCPAFYVESLDALLLTRRQRMLQAAAGPWAEWLAMSVVATAFLALDPGDNIARILQRFVVVNTIVLGTNLLPFAGFDGALLLGDLLRQPDLTARASLFAAGDGRGRWITSYRGLNGLVSAGLLIMAGYFWWQLFGGLTTSLWTWEPAGAAIVTAVALLLGRQLLVMVEPSAAAVLAHLRRSLAAIKFRCERRWRVEAIHAFRTVPEFAELTATELGVLAGRLQRCRGCPAGLPGDASHVYVRRLPSEVMHAAGGGPKRGAVIDTRDCAPTLLPAGSDIVTMPSHWRSYIAAD
jgi:hypothetical protein